MAAETKSGMDVQGLASLWESNAEVRKLAREHGLLMKVPPGASFCDSNRPNAVANTEFLIPCLQRMYENDLKLPYIGPLQEEIELFFHHALPECVYVRIWKKTHVYSTYI